VDRSRVSAWCKGQFLGPRQMKIEQFQELVNIFWHQPGGIETVAGILALASCIGKLASGQHIFDLVKNLDYQWLLSLGYNLPMRLENMHLLDDRYPYNPPTLPRENVLERLTSLLNYAGVSNCPIVISGQPGIGKSTLLAHLKDSSWGQAFEKKRMIYLNGGGVDAYLHIWHEEIYGSSAPADMHLENLANRIRKHEQATRQIVLVDAVSHLRFIQPILQIFKNTDSVVLLTLYQGSTLAGLRTDPRLVTTLPGFSLAESIELYAKWGESLDPEDLTDFTALHTMLKGNPLALFFAFQNLERTELADLVSSLNGTHLDVPQFLLPENFLHMQVGYERLPVNFQKAFARLGTLKRLDVIDLDMLAALWANSPEEIHLDEANALVDQLQASISPFELVPGTRLKWSLHAQTHLFAQSKFVELDENERWRARQWAGRLAQARLPKDAYRQLPLAF
jgi:hypothetical protein